MERLQKILAKAGIASRRAAEKLIVSGRVRVNGQVVSELGASADPDRDKIEVDGKRAIAERPVYLILHKPRGVVSTAHDPEGRPTVLELLQGIEARLYPVGRLDFQTSGALLLTNDGDFAAAMLHPKHNVPKLYLVKVEGDMDDAQVERWSKGIELEDGRTMPAEVHVTRREPGRTWLEVILHEGRNQQIRRMGEASGFPVLRLTRLSVAGISIDGLRAGSWRFLTIDELKDLRENFGVPKRLRPAATRVEDLPNPQESRRQGARRGGLPARPAPATARSAPATARPARDSSNKPKPSRPQRPSSNSAPKPAPRRSREK